MNVLAFPTPPSRCECGCTRLNHPGGERCRLCKCRAFQQYGEKVRPIATPDPVLFAPSGAPRSPRSVAYIRRAAEITRLAGEGKEAWAIVQELGTTYRIVAMALKKGSAA